MLKEVLLSLTAHLIVTACVEMIVRTWPVILAVLIRFI